jgi:hypothetical protein
VILSLLTLPFRLLGFAILAGLIWLGWNYRTELRRYVHRVTADPGAPASPPGAPAPPPVNQVAARARATRRLDSLERHRADSIVLPSSELEAMLAAPLAERTGGAVDSVRIELGDGEVAVSGRVDPSALPKGTVGPLAEWIPGREMVTAKGTVSLRRVGTGEVRLTDVKVRGLPLPRAVWSRLLPASGGAAEGAVTVPLAPWITGLRVTPDGLVLYGKVER